MRYLWVDRGNNADFTIGAKYGIDGYFFDPRDERVSKAYLEDVVAKGKAVGIYIGAGWGEVGDTPVSYVSRVTDWMIPLRKDNNFPKVQFDIELHDPVFVLEVLRLWRKAYPWQATSWSLESMQGGWMSPEFVAGVVAAHCRVSPQYYGGDMTPIAPDRAFRNLALAGFPLALISGTYDAARLDAWWDGFAFTQGRLK